MERQKAIMALEEKDKAEAEEEEETKAPGVDGTAGAAARGNQEEGAKDETMSAAENTEGVERQPA